MHTSTRLLRISGFRVVAGFGVLLLASLATSCSSTRLASEPEACRVMREQVREKQALDARVKALGKEAANYRKKGDSASMAAAASAESRLNGLVESQRFLKESLDRNSEDCRPTMHNPSPVLDPARRERVENAP